MQIIWIILTIGIVGACVWSFIKRFTGKKTCCGTEKQPRIKTKKLSAPIGSLTLKISGIANISFERNISDEELILAVDAAGFDVVEINR